MRNNKQSLKIKCFVYLKFLTKILSLSNKLEIYHITKIVHDKFNKNYQIGLTLFVFL